MGPCLVQTAELHIYQNEGKSCLPWNQKQLASTQWLALHAGDMDSFPKLNLGAKKLQCQGRFLPSLYELLVLRSNLSVDLDQPQSGKALEM